MIKYRVKIKVEYAEAHFDYEDSRAACEFAENALKHSVKSKDSDRQTHIELSVIEEGENEETV